MNYEGSKTHNIHRELRKLEEDLREREWQLKTTRKKSKGEDLQEYLDEIKMDLGWEYLDSKKYEEGMVLLNSVSWKKHGEMKCNVLARALTEMGYYDEARRLLKAGLKRFPKSYALWVAMGALHDSLGDDFESLNCMEIALRFAPEDNSAGLYNKALVLIKLGCYGDALPIIDELIERYPGDPKHLAERGALALEMGYPQEALQYYQKAMEVWQRSPNVYDGLCIYTGLCSSYLELGMKREAMEIALEGLKRFPDEDSALYHNAGAAFYNMGWRNECMEILKKGHEKFPNDEELKKFLKDVEDDMDDPDKGDKPPILGLLLLMALIHKKFKNAKK